MPRARRQPGSNARESRMKPATGWGASPVDRDGRGPSGEGRLPAEPGHRIVIEQERLARWSSGPGTGPPTERCCGDVQAAQKLVGERPRLLRCDG